METEMRYRALREIATSDGIIKKGEFIPNPSIFQRMKTLVDIGWVEIVIVAIENESENNKKVEKVRGKDKKNSE